MTSSDSTAFQPIANPYIVGNPIEDRKMFFGREDDFTYIKQKITGSSSGGMIVLCGTRRSGKTSILFQIKGGRLGESFLPVLIDMQSMTVQDDKEFLARLAQEILAALKCPDLSYERDFLARVDGNPYAAFLSLAKNIDGQLRGRKLVLMFDEYELFETHIENGRISADILNLLSTWLERQPRVFVIFTGSDQLEARDPRFWSAFLGKALHRRISFLSERDTRRLILEPVAGKVTYAPSTPQEIYKLTAGQPFYAQVLCQTIVDHLNEKRKCDVSLADIGEAVGDIIDNPLPQMIFTWSSLSDLEKVGLSIVAELSKEEQIACSAGDLRSFAVREKTGYRLNSGKLNEALERLFHQDLLYKEIETENYSFKMDLWRQWMARMHTIWQVLDEITSDGRELGDGIVKESVHRRRLMIWSAVAVLAVAVGGPVLLREFGLIAGRGNGPIQAIPDSSYVSIASTPAGAIVFLDEMRLGPTPVQARRVEAGSKVLRLELTGFRDVSDSLSLTKDDTVARDYILAERRGKLSVTSEPPGAAIMLDRNRTGLTTPTTLEDLSVNRRHEIVLSLAGYLDKTLYADLTEDSTTVVHHAFVKVTHPLTIMSEPTGASVQLDGRRLGTTPQSLPNVAEGDHRLEFSLDNYHAEQVDIVIPAPGNRVSIELRRLPPGTLVFQIEPYAELWINGELMDEIVQHRSYSLDQGTYRCELRNPYFDTMSKSVEVASGDTTTVTYDFENPGDSP